MQNLQTHKLVCGRIHSLGALDFNGKIIINEKEERVVNEKQMFIIFDCSLPRSPLTHNPLDNVTRRSVNNSLNDSFACEWQMLNKNRRICSQSEEIIHSTGTFFSRIASRRRFVSLSTSCIPIETLIERRIICP